MMKETDKLTRDELLNQLKDFSRQIREKDSSNQELHGWMMKSRKEVDDLKKQQEDDHDMIDEIAQHMINERHELCARLDRLELWLRILGYAKKEKEGQ